MHIQGIGSVTRAAVVSVLLLPGMALAQAPAAWSPSRTPDGQPNIQGVWDPVDGGASHSLEQGSEPAQDAVTSNGPRASTLAARRREFSVKVTVEPDGKLPYQPWAAAKREDHLRNLFAPTAWAQLDPEDRCLPNGVPRINYRNGFRIVQTPGHVGILYEWNHGYRVIPIDGSPHPSSGIRLWNGDSRGRWEGNTLVVDVANFLVDAQNFNMQPWFDSHGTFYSDALHVVERWTFADANRIQYEATIEDPKVFTKPWKMAITINRNKEADYELFEVACLEGDRNTSHMVDVGRVMRARGETGIHDHPVP